MALTTDNGFHWRLWYNGQAASYVLNLDKKIDSNYKANIYLFTKKYVDTWKEKPTNRIFIKTYQLTAQQANQIATLLQDQHISEIPTDSLIKGWGDIIGFDGITYNIEEVSDNAYSSKSYWTPSSINVKEAKHIQAFLNSIENIVDSKQLFVDFTKHVPFAAYKTGGPTTGIKIMTKKQQSELKKERDAYRKTHELVDQ
ncbi:hypothetical protein GCM10027037_21380 [Mucilaginibacter koreensis]